MVKCGIYFAEPDTIFVFKIFYEVLGGGTYLAMPKTICAPDSSSRSPSPLGLVLEIRTPQRQLRYVRVRESWIRGYPDYRAIYIVRTIEA